VTSTVRPTRQQVDEQIVDRAAALFAQHGFAQTSLQAIADAVGYSKAGLLHHFPSKEELYAAAVSLTRASLQQILDVVADLPLGPERDRRGLAEVVGWALRSPGQTALGLSSVTRLAGDSPFKDEATDGVPLLLVFGIGPDDCDPGRLIRVVSALSGVLVTTLVAHHTGAGASWQDAITRTAFDALGHRDAGVLPAQHPDQVEA
jgi:AcrR family transcriptional regulator